MKAVTSITAAIKNPSHFFIFPLLYVGFSKDSPKWLLLYNTQKILPKQKARSSLAFCFLIKLPIRKDDQKRVVQGAPEQTGAGVFTYIKIVCEEQRSNAKLFICP
jgi:hypothetical protein